MPAMGEFDRSTTNIIHWYFLVLFGALPFD